MHCQWSRVLLVLQLTLGHATVGDAVQDLCASLSADETQAVCNLALLQEFSDLSVLTLFRVVQSRVCLAPRGGSVIAKQLVA